MNDKLKRTIRIRKYEARQKVESYMRNKIIASYQDIQDNTSVSYVASRRVLNDMEREGIVVRVPGQKSPQWHLKMSLDDLKDYYPGVSEEKLVKTFKHVRKDEKGEGDG